MKVNGLKSEWISYDVLNSGRSAGYNGENDRMTVWN